MSKLYFIGIAGGSGSGKTYVAQQILKQAASEKVVLIPLDAYYKNLEHLSFEERASQNFDHPDAIDITLLEQHLKTLQQGNPINRPVYDFTSHLRSREKIRIENPHVVIVEGILALHFASLRQFFSLNIFVDTPADLRLIRRLQRDVQERGRTVESVLHQYQETVRPMHLRFVEPSKRYADLILFGDRDNSGVLEMVVARILHWIRDP